MKDLQSIQDTALITQSNFLITDGRVLEAIEAITGGNFECNGDCGSIGCDGTHPKECNDPAVRLWCDNGNEDKIKDWLDIHYPSWREDAPLLWGESELTK